MCDVTEIQSPVSGDLVEILYAVSITLITRDKPGQYSLSADKKKKNMWKRNSAKYKTGEVVATLSLNLHPKTQSP